MQSLASRFMPAVIRLRGSKKRYSSAERTLARVEQFRQHPKNPAPPASLTRTHTVTERTVDGWPVYELALIGATPSRRALYLHGGSYVFEISSQHWSLAAELCRTADARVVVPIYPLAPRGTAASIVSGCAGLAAALIAEVGSRNVTVIGDSAGGGLTLSTALELRDRGLGQVGLVLISPILDLALTDPDVAAIAPRDPWLDIPGSRATGELFRGDLPLDDPRVSPIHGDLRGLGPILMFSGTRDMLNADARRLVREHPSHEIDYVEVAQMIHVYPLLPIPEARTARARIGAFMTR